ncbi:MAG: Nif-specific regulatory protein [Syntrophorhabdaceae bacterium PtaU1.Bin034]|jgi:transcriptional regulator with GAF, ATPase, and Fis domain|nr:MAG: Nif-specific regulatory protein [Syntrophorhabdaceae bacterium PtaU1.Bin034]
MKGFSNMLISFVGNQDPTTRDRKTDEITNGPILTVIENRKDINEVLLLHTPDKTGDAEATENMMKAANQNIVVKRVTVGISDPTNHEEILKVLKEVFRKISEFERKSFFISVSSGTPAMHACLLLLAASGEIPANVFHIRERRHVGANMPLIREVNPRAKEFPRIVPYTTLEEVLNISEAEKRAAIEGVGIIGDNPRFRDALDQAALAARSDLPVLILGENGTGKDRVANFIHEVSKRRGKAFVAVNCGAVPSTLFESEFFGHLPGSFTGAINRRKGRFDEADGGTIFLDEIGETPPDIQVKFLRVLQNGEIHTLGASSPHKVNVRILAATNKNVEQAISEKQFREDLYYRLSTVVISLPPLRERKGDIPKLALLFLDDFNKRNNRVKELSPLALRTLQNQRWPGNIRELQNVVQRSALATRDRVILPEHLRFDGFRTPVAAVEPHEGFKILAYLDDEKERLYRKALEMAGNNQSKAARLLGISPQAMSEFVKKGHVSE